MEALRRLRAYWIDYPVADLLFIAVAIATQIRFGLASSDSKPEARFVWYQTTSGVFGAMAGFSVAAIAIVYSVSPGDRLKHAFDSVSVKLSQLLGSGIGVLVIGSLLAMAAIPLDTTHDAGWVAGVIEIATLGALLHLGRMLWILRRLLSALSLDNQSPPASVDSWRKPTVSSTDYQIESRN